MFYNPIYSDRNLLSSQIKIFELNLIDSDKHFSDYPEKEYLWESKIYKTKISAENIRELKIGEFQ